MPKAPRFQTETAQQTAVGAVTCVTLLIAMGLAQWFTWSHQADYGAKLSPQSVGDLGLLLPADWQRRDVRAPDLGFTGTMAELLDPQIKGRLMLIGRADVATPQAPDDLLRTMLNRLSRKDSRVFVDKEAIRRFRVGTFSAALYHAQSQSASTIFSECVLVFSEDARRHWVAVITMPPHASQEVAKAQETLLLTMARSATDRAYRSATDADLEAAGLPELAPLVRGIKISDLGPGGTDMPKGSRPDSALHLMLADENQPELGVVRVRWTIDPQVTQPMAPLSPSQGLRRLFSDVHSREPDPTELVMEEIDGQPAARLTMSDGKQGLLLRQVLYVRVGPERGLLFDMIAEPGAMEGVQRIALGVMQIAKAAAADTIAPADASAIALSIVRGAELAAAQRRHMTQTFRPTEGPADGRVVLRDGQVIGTQVEDRRHVPSHTLPLQRRHVRTMSSGDGSYEVWSHWFASPDGMRLEHSIFREIKQGPVDRTQAYQLVVQGDRIGLSQVPLRQGRDPIWTATVGKGYLPGLAEESWDVEALKKAAGTGPMLIWRSRSIEPPSPHWLTVSGDFESEKTDHPAQGAIVLTIRPMMGVDAESLWLDRNGNVLASDWMDIVRFPAGGRHLGMIPADLDTILKINPANRKVLSLWQRESNHQ